MINLKRAYDPANSADGTRLLIERLWPRGVKKTSLKIKSWIKDVAQARNCGNGSLTIPRSGTSSAAAISIN